MRWELFLSQSKSVGLRRMGSEERHRNDACWRSTKTVHSGGISVPALRLVACANAWRRNRVRRKSAVRISTIGCTGTGGPASHLHMRHNQNSRQARSISACACLLAAVAMSAGTVASSPYVSLLLGDPFATPRRCKWVRRAAVARSRCRSFLPVAVQLPRRTWAAGRHIRLRRIRQERKQVGDLLE